MGVLSEDQMTLSHANTSLLVNLVLIHTEQVKPTSCKGISQLLDKALSELRQGFTP